MAKNKLSDPETRAKVISTLRSVKSEKNAYHVIRSKGNWVVFNERKANTKKAFPDQAHAIEHARDLARESKADLIVHRSDGGMQEQISFRDSDSAKKSVN
jgi:hypothetical protein